MSPEVLRKRCGQVKPSWVKVFVIVGRTVRFGPSWDGVGPRLGARNFGMGAEWKDMWMLGVPATASRKRLVMPSIPPDFCVSRFPQVV